MAQSNGNAQAIAEAAVAAVASKPKRVRTGCLTCRERHLKCDETFPGDCLNCRKSSRVCKRGVKLNFIDTTCKQPPVMQESDEWEVCFLDESRDIASGYMGGAQQYASRDPDTHMTYNNEAAFQYNDHLPPPPVLAHQQLPGKEEIQSGNMHTRNVFEHEQQNALGSTHGLNTLNSSYSFSSGPSQPQQQAYQPVHQELPPPEQPSEPKEILTTREETLYMQVFVEEVGLWMDSMDSHKHFSRLLPFHALGQPMLLNAFLACGARHLTLVNPKTYQESDSLAYYDKASSLLLRALQNPERDSVICATTAVILNVYEIMTEKVLLRMNHIAGARALIKECGWNARSTGIGAACFWLNVGMELLSNLGFKWQSSWHPDTWGLDLDFERETEMGREEIWTHRIVYISAKIGDYRATVPTKPQSSPMEEQTRRQKRVDEWMQLKMLADAWHDNIPRTMQPMAYLRPYQTSSGSAFPEVWLIKRSTIVARLFYHTALCLLAQVHPTLSTHTKEMHDMELYHAHQVCGITAHVKDRGVASVALRSLAIAGECLTVRREQEEVLEIFKRIHNDTGWRIGYIPGLLRDKWGWNAPDQSPGSVHSVHTSFSAATSVQTPSMDKYAHQNLPQSTTSDVYALRHFDKYAAEMETQRQQQQQQQEVSYAHQQQQYQQQQQQMQHMQQQQQQQHQQQEASYAHQQQQYQQQHQHQQQQQPQQQQHQVSPALSTPPAAPRPRPPQGIVNPMFATADFGMAKHPYQEYYVAPTRHAGMWDQGTGQGLELGGYPAYSGGYGHGQQ